MEETGEEGVMREVMEEGQDWRLHPVAYQFSTPNLYLYSGLRIFHTLDMFYIVRSERPLTCRGKRRRCRIPVDSSERDTDRELRLRSIRKGLSRFLQKSPEEKS